MKAFPSTLSSAFWCTCNWYNAPKLNTKIIENEIDGIAFAHIGENKKEKQKKTKHYYSNSCPKEQNDAYVLLNGQEVQNISDEDEFTFFMEQYSANNQF